MITLDKLRTYLKFNGDIDGWARAPKGNAKVLMTDADWHLIDELLTGLTTIGTGLASPSLVSEIENKVRASTADEATHAALRALVVRHGQNNAA